VTPTKNWTTRRRSSDRFAVSTHITRIIKALLTLALGTLLILPGALPAAASGPTAPNTTTPNPPAGTATFGVQPVTGGKPDTRGQLTYSATPGAKITDHVAVRNYSAEPLQLHVYANDAFNTIDGGFGIQAASVPPTDLGAWVHLNGPTFVVVPGRSMVIVPITIAIPVNATPGDHAGGVMAGLNRIATDAKGNRVNVEERVGTRVYIRVPGKLSAALALTNVRTTYHNSLNPIGSGSATVTYTVRNTGNVRLAGVQNVSVSSFIGGSRRAVGLKDIKELLPGQQITLSATVGGVLPSFVTTGRVTIDPSALPGDIDPKASSVSGSASAASVPWALLVVIVLLGGLTFEFLRRRRKPAVPNRPGSGGAPKAASESEPKAAAKAGAAKAGAAGVKTGG
jgi:hypothetical protein